MCCVELQLVESLQKCCSRNKYKVVLTVIYLLVTNVNGGSRMWEGGLSGGLRAEVVSTGKGRSGDKDPQMLAIFCKLCYTDVL